MSSSSSLPSDFSSNSPLSHITSTFRVSINDRPKATAFNFQYDRNRHIISFPFYAHPYIPKVKVVFAFHEVDTLTKFIVTHLPFAKDNKSSPWNDFNVSCLTSVPPEQALKLWEDAFIMDNVPTTPHAPNPVEKIQEKMEDVIPKTTNGPPYGHVDFVGLGKELAQKAFNAKEEGKWKGACDLFDAAILTTQDATRYINDTTVRKAIYLEEDKWMNEIKEITRDHSVPGRGPPSYRNRIWEEDVKEIPRGVQMFPPGTYFIGDFASYLAGAELNGDPESIGKKRKKNGPTDTNKSSLLTPDDVNPYVGRIEVIRGMKFVQYKSHDGKGVFPSSQLKQMPGTFEGKRGYKYGFVSLNSGVVGCCLLQHTGLSEEKARDIGLVVTFDSNFRVEKKLRWIQVGHVKVYTSLDDAPVPCSQALIQTELTRM